MCLIHPHLVQRQPQLLRGEQKPLIAATGHLPLLPPPAPAAASPNQPSATG
jgi:hypothetical protein